MIYMYTHIMNLKWPKTLNALFVFNFFCRIEKDFGFPFVLSIRICNRGTFLTNAEGEQQSGKSSLAVDSGAIFFSPHVFENRVFIEN